MDPSVPDFAYFPKIIVKKRSKGAKKSKKKDYGRKGKFRGAISKV